MKGNKGITLIALVITIIVLLILAAVSIAMLTGDNSILGNAAKSADYNKIGEVKDEIALRVNEYVMSYLEKVYNNGTYVGTATGIDSAQKAAIDAVTTYSTTKATVNPIGTPVTKITITSGEYYDVGTIDSDKGSVTWTGIQKGTAPTT